MRLRRAFQLTSAILVAASTGVASVGRMGNLPRHGQPAIDAAQDWKSFIVSLLEGVLRYLRCRDPGPESVQGAIEAVRECYYSTGIPPGADLADGRALVEQLYIFLLADPGVLDPVTRLQFAFDLTQMYIELGGNPENLGQ